MYCPNCGKEFGNGSIFCPGCGYSVMGSGNNNSYGGPDQKWKRNSRNQSANRSMGNPYQQQNLYGGPFVQQNQAGGNSYGQNSYNGNPYQQQNRQSGGPFPQQNGNGFQPNRPYMPNNPHMPNQRNNPGYPPNMNQRNPVEPQKHSNRGQKRKSNKIWILLPIILVLIAVITGGTIFLLTRSGEEEVPGVYEPEKFNMASDKEKSPSAKERELPSLSECKVGEKIFFGEYEQDNNSSNGEGALEWIILAKDENGALIITKDCIDAGAFNTKDGDTNWATSSIRDWLNNEFRQKAFSPDELSLIECRTIENKANTAEGYMSTGSDATQDSIFLLSQEEVIQYMNTDAKRKAAASKYAEAKGLSVDSTEGASSWWLRTPGFTNEDVEYVMTDGKIMDFGSLAYFDNIGIRPAMWITMG